MKLGSRSSLNYCPFRGCAGDWVKLGVAKRHGAVLGDAICLNSSLPCVLVDVVRCKMGKFSCCVPGCTNNWRNSPEKKFHTLPSDAKVRRLYEKLIRNENLKLNAQHTRICGDHFPDGERMCRTQNRSYSEEWPEYILLPTEVCKPENSSYKRRQVSSFQIKSEFRLNTPLDMARMINSK